MVLRVCVREGAVISSGWFPRSRITKSKSYNILKIIFRVTALYSNRYVTATVHSRPEPDARGRPLGFRRMYPAARGPSHCPARLSPRQGHWAGEALGWGPGDPGLFWLHHCLLCASFGQLLSRLRREFSHLWNGNKALRSVLVRKQQHLWKLG